MIRIGFTGTRRGMTSKQRETIYKVLLKNAVSEVHHGDCIGADADMHELVSAYRQNAAFPRLIIHPPTLQGQRAFCRGDIERPQELSSSKLRYR